MYKEKRLNLQNLLSFWVHFKEEEKFLFYNANEKELIIGAKRLKSFNKYEDLKGYKYIFSTKTFFEQAKDSIWNGFNSENIAFYYYLKVKDGEQILYYKDDDVEIKDAEFNEEFYKYTIQNEDYEDWQKLFNSGYEKILSKEAEKVVISRQVIINLSKEAKEEFIIKRLMDNNPHNFIFAYKKGEKCFLGATPEILLEKKEGKIISHAVAGTLIKSYDNYKEERECFLKDKKNAYEHELVVSDIKNIFENFGQDTKASKTKLIETKNLYHLHTELSTSSYDDILTWRDRLHPTPALGGMPRELALNVIKENEEHERGFYASPIGVIDERGDGIFVVAIRSGVVYKDKLYVYAGCGLVQSSDSTEEFSETEGKLKTILECI